MDYLEAIHRAKSLPQDSNLPIYQDLQGNKIERFFFVCYDEKEPNPTTFFNNGSRTIRADGGWYYLISSKTDENGNILPKKQYRNYVTFRKKYARKQLLVKGVSYDIVGLKRRSTHLPPAVLLANVKFIK